jgi:hypothetical protein
MGVVSIRVIDLVGHPRAQIFTIELNVSMFEGHFPVADSQPVTKCACAIWPGWY